MSHNVELVESAYEAFGRGDIPALMENFAEDIDWHAPPRLPQAMDAHGHDEVGEFFQQVGEAWSDFNVEIDDVYVAPQPELL